MTASEFDFDSISYPAFVVVFGPSKRYISSFNRSEYDEHFACSVCPSARAAKELLEGYPGRIDDLSVYAVPSPAAVLRLYRGGPTHTEWLASWEE